MLFLIFSSHPCLDSNSFLIDLAQSIVSSTYQTNDIINDTNENSNDLSFELVNDNTNDENKNGKNVTNYLLPFPKIKIPDLNNSSNS
jgi:hypothetical protein